jgi:hypothetical protein
MRQSNDAGARIRRQRWILIEITKSGDSTVSLDAPRALREGVRENKTC